MATNHFTFEFELNSIFEKLDEQAIKERKNNIKQLRELNILSPDPTDAAHISLESLFEIDSW